MKRDPDAKDRVLQSERKMKNETRFPAGWNEDRVQRILQHYELQTEEEVVAEDEAVWEDTTQTVMEIPNALVPSVRALLGQHAE